LIFVAPASRRPARLRIHAAFRLAAERRQECSPRREPWVEGRIGPSPDGAKNLSVACLMRVFRPFGPDSILAASHPRLAPWAVFFAPLRGSNPLQRVARVASCAFSASGASCLRGGVDARPTAGETPALLKSDTSEGARVYIKRRRRRLGFFAAAGGPGKSGR
jgi:hypothetical protein